MTILDIVILKKCTFLKKYFSQSASNSSHYKEAHRMGLRRQRRNWKRKETPQTGSIWCNEIQAEIVVSSNFLAPTEEKPPFDLVAWFSPPTYSWYCAGKLFHPDVAGWWKRHIPQHCIADLEFYYFSQQSKGGWGREGLPPFVYVTLTKDPSFLWRFQPSSPQTPLLSTVLLRFILVENRGTFQQRENRLFLSFTELS